MLSDTVHDNNSAFNTIIPTKLQDLGLDSRWCNRILDILMAASHPPLSPSAQELLRVVCSAPSCTLSIHDCVAQRNFNILKVTDDTTTVSRSFSQV